MLSSDHGPLTRDFRIFRVLWSCSNFKTVSNWDRHFMTKSDHRGGNRGASNGHSSVRGSLSLCRFRKCTMWKDVAAVFLRLLSIARYPFIAAPNTDPPWATKPSTHWEVYDRHLTPDLSWWNLIISYNYIILSQTRSHHAYGCILHDYFYHMAHCSFRKYTYHLLAQSAIPGGSSLSQHQIA